MDMPQDIGAAFTDAVVATFAKDSEVLQSVVKEPLWDKDSRTLLSRIEPKNKDTAKQVAEQTVELIRQVKGFEFTASLQEMEVDGKMNWFFKLTVKK